MIDLSQYHSRLEDVFVGVVPAPYTQFGQGGVLRKIFEVIGTTNKYFVEFGSEGHDYGEGNTAHLRYLGWDGLLMDIMRRPNAKYPVKTHLVSSENVNYLFEQYNVPFVFDFLSIDIDGNDFYVWRDLDPRYRPRVVSIEANGFFLDKYDCVMPYDSNYFLPPQYPRDKVAGASAKAIFNLGRSKHYTYVAQCSVDCIFIADEVIEQTNTEWLNANNFDKIFHAYHGDIVTDIDKLHKDNQQIPPKEFLSSLDLI